MKCVSPAFSEERRRYSTATETGRLFGLLRSLRRVIQNGSAWMAQSSSLPYSTFARRGKGPREQPEGCGAHACSILIFARWNATNEDDMPWDKYYSIMRGSPFLWLFRKMSRSMLVQKKFYQNTPEYGVHPRYRYVRYR